MSSGFPPWLAEPRLVCPHLRARTLEPVLPEMAEALAVAGVLRDPVELAERPLKREREGCTSLADAIARALKKSGAATFAAAIA